VSATRSDIESRIAARGRIGEDEVLAIRRLVFSDGVLRVEEADWLFFLNDRFPEHDRAWISLFVGDLTDLMVNHMPPRGYVASEKVDWLLARILHDGEVRTATELELLINVLEKAISAPDHLAVFALQQVKAHVLRSNRLGGPEVALLRRVLYAAGGHQAIAITRPEAEVIYDIHDARGGTEDDPAWLDLFSKALLNHLMFASGFEPPTREEALRREAWLDDTNPDPVRFMRSMAVGLKELIGLYRAPSFEDEYLRRREAIQAAAEEVTDEEASWLARRMLRDDALTGAEHLLIDALRAEHPRLHPAIQAAIDRMS